MRKLTFGTIACGMTLVLALAGCGGGGGSAAPTDAAAPADDAAQEQEEPAFNVEDFYGCWEYDGGYGWVCIYDDGTYEWYSDDGSSTSGTYEVSEDGVMSLEGANVSYALDGEGGLVDSDGDELFLSDLPEFEDELTEEDGGGDHESSGRDYDTLAGTSWVFSPEVFAFYDDGTIEVYDEDDYSVVGAGEYYWSDAEQGQVGIETPTFGETIMYLYFDSYGNLIFDEGEDGTSYILQPV